jgi:hypothetical protein
MTFGTGYAGLSGFGLGTPTGLPSPGAAYLRSADLTPARALDLAARDYAVDDDTTASPHGAWDGLAQNVVLRLTTRRGRLPYAPTFGNAFLTLTRAPASLVDAASRAATDALADLIAAGEVAIVRVTADRSQGLAVMAVTWRDLRTQTERTTRSVAPGA